MIKKILLTIPASLAGPVLVLITMFFYDWSVNGGILTAAIVSLLALKMVWFPEKPKSEASHDDKH